MKKILLIFGLYFLSLAAIISKPVDETTAQKVAKNFIASNTNISLSDLNFMPELAYTGQSKSTSQNNLTYKTAYYYVFNINKSGFVIISADDNVIPVLGYSTESIFEPDNLPLHILKWFENYKNQIRYAIENNIKAGNGVKQKWDLYLKSDEPVLMGDVESIGPLLQTKWGQRDFYNELCPYDSDYKKLTLTGCVATTMAQIMKYWNYPERGRGNHSYIHKKFGQLSTNFSNTYFYWEEMPEKLTSSNEAVALLMKQCGISVDMKYGVDEEGGSSARVIRNNGPYDYCAEAAFEENFGFNTTAKGFYREDLTDNKWKEILFKELKEKRPVFYAGYSKIGGHAFVFDGFDKNGYFHINWGWDGKFDGYFPVDSLVPYSEISNNEPVDFNIGHMAITGIQPYIKKPYNQLFIGDSITFNPAKLKYSSDLYFKTSFVNKGTINFNGEYASALFDENMNFIDYIGIRGEFELPAGKKGNFGNIYGHTFSLLPGKYYIKYMYRTTETEWEPFKNNNNIKNLAELIVENHQNIELCKKTKIDVKNYLVNSKKATVYFNLKNIDSIPFKGNITIDIYDEYKRLIQNIGTYNVADELKPGDSLSNDYISIINDSISAIPGKYYLTVKYKRENDQYDNYAGSDLFQNPVLFYVLAPELQPDKYEKNNTLTRSSALELFFPENKSTVFTTGSNLHDTSDTDYYKVKLNYGFDYNLKARIYDINSSIEENNYSADVKFTVSKDGTNWSDEYDESMSDKISVNGDNYVYFHVTPFLNGQKGTYKLEINLDRSTSTNIIDYSENESVRIYPNPANDFVNIDFSAFDAEIYDISIQNILGQEIQKSVTENHQKFLNILLENCPQGINNMILNTSKGIIKKKIIILK